jgi:glycosyltransferase involved in cell wall biosynthesis
MATNANILFVFDPKNSAGKSFVQALHQAMQDWQITLKETSHPSFLFDYKNYDLVHVFHSASSGLPALLNRAKGKTHTVQTVFTAPKKQDDYGKIICAEHSIVFSEQEKKAIQQVVSGAAVDCVLPCVELPPLAQRKPPGQVRSELGVGESLLSTGFAELTNQKDFLSVLYVVREYQRRGGFRLLLEILHPTRETKKWKERLLLSMDKEKLTATTLLNDSYDRFSTIDASDIVLHLTRQQDTQFSVPLIALQSLSLGKPLLCYNVSPVNEAIHGFRPEWVCQNTEDVVRISVDIGREAAHLEQISTEVARYARDRISPAALASRYQEIYNRLLNDKTS